MSRASCSLDTVDGQAMISQLQWTAPPIPKPQPNWASLIQVKDLDIRKISIRI